MTPEQNKLIHKTLSVIGYLSLIGAIGLVLYGFVWTVTNDKDFGDLLNALLDVRDEVDKILYSLVGR